MESLKDILSSQPQNSALMKGITASLIVEFCLNLFIAEWGAVIEQQARPVSIKKHVLTIACLTSSAANEIKLKQNKFIQAINREFGADSVREFKFML